MQAESANYNGNWSMC